MYQVEFLCVDPFVFEIVYFEGTVYWDAEVCQSGFGLFVPPGIYKFGWMGLKSVPMIADLGCSMAGSFGK